MSHTQGSRATGKMLVAPVDCARGLSPLEVSANQRWGSVSLADKTAATVDKGITLACDALIVAGVAKPNGVYREAKLPGVLTGDGRILVGEEPGTAVVLC